MASHLNDKQKRMIGSWRQFSAENIDEYLKATGMGSLTRRMVAVFEQMWTPVLHISVSDAAEWTARVEIPLKPLVVTFRMKEEFTFQPAFGDALICVTEMDEDGVQTDTVKTPQKGKESETSVFRRYVDEEDQLIIAAEYNGVLAKRICRRV